MIVLSEAERAQLTELVKALRTQRRYADRARIVLKAAEGMSNRQIAVTLSVRQATVSKWRVRFESERLEALHDAYRPGRPHGPEEPEKLRSRMLAMIDLPAPEGYARWNGRLLAQAPGVNAHAGWKHLRQLGISLQRRRSWCVSTDPEFAAKSADVIGLYLGAPANAVVPSPKRRAFRPSSGLSLFTTKPPCLSHGRRSA